MSLGTSLFLIAVGAVLRFAVTVTTKGFNLHSIGVILMIVGAIGLILSIFWMTMWSNRRGAVVDDGYGRVPRDRVPPRSY